LRKDENWTSVVELKKGNYNIIMLSAEFVPNENLLTILEKIIYSYKRQSCVISILEMDQRTGL